MLIPTPGIRPDGERPSSGAPGPGGERAVPGVSLLEGAEWVRGGFARRGWIWDYAELPDTEPGSAGAGLDYEALREALAASRMPDGRDAEFDERIAAVQEGRLAQWRVIVTTPAGQAIAVSRVRRPRGRGGGARDRPPGPAPPGAGLVGRVTVTISQDVVTDSRQEASGPGPPGGMAAAAQAAAARALDKARAQAEPDSAAGGCSHHDQSAAYRPPPRLRECVTARDLTCRNPVCRQPAWRADLDHTKPWAPGGTGGSTCQCNLGGRCRRDHILKQHPRWGFAQDGGEFTWTAPSGRRYTVGPDTHPV